MADHTRKKRPLLIFGVVLLSFHSAYASYLDLPVEHQNKALEATLTARNLLVERMQKIETEAVFKETIKATVKDALSVLLVPGSKERLYGVQIKNDWEKNGLRALDKLSTDFNSFPFNPMHGFMNFSSLDEISGARDLGDHAPLFKWLGRFYEGLMERQGSLVLRDGFLSDLYDLTYSLPVVFSPRTGTWKLSYPSKKHWVEYRRHFIPMMKVGTYYATFLPCKYVLPQYGYQLPERFCKMASQLLKHVMGRYVAWKVSDFIFYRTNKTQTTWNITKEDLKINTVDELKEEMNKGEFQ